MLGASVRWYGVFPLLLLAVLAGCAERQPGQQPSGRPTPRTATFAATVVDVQPGRSDREAVIRVRLPGNRRDCGHDPRISRSEQDRGLFYLNVVYSAATDLARGSCPFAASAGRTGQVRFTATVPLTGRTLVLNSMSTWHQEGTGYRQCDQKLGCSPPADHCDRTWRDAALGQLDVPRHSRVATRACDGHWMVIDIDTGAAACTRINAAANGCTAIPDATRYFLSFTGAGWDVITGTRTAGCGQVRSTQPAFPTRLCQDLPAPS